MWAVIGELAAGAEALARSLNHEYTLIHISALGVGRTHFTADVFTEAEQIAERPGALTRDLFVRERNRVADYVILIGAVAI